MSEGVAWREQGAFVRFQDALNRAVYDPAAWSEALEALADGFGCNIGHYIGWSGPAAPQVNLSHGMSDAAAAHYMALGGGDPGQNVMVATGIRMPAGRLYTSDDVWSREQRRRSALWNEFFAPNRIDHMAAVVMAREGLDHFVLNVTREGARGGFDADEQLQIQEGADRWLRSMQTARAMGVQTAKIATAALDEVKSAAFLFDGLRRIVGATTAGERLLGADGPLRLSYGRLAALDAATTDRLNAALAVAIGAHGPPAASSARIRTGRGDLLVRFSPLPQQTAIGSEAVAVAVIETAPLELTPAEAAVVEGLAEGRRPSDIAAARGVSLETVRSQIKAIYRKTGATSQIELLSLLQRRVR